MAEARYLISDAAKKVDVESHVLRYWEEELELNIPRNEMGHRYYTDYHIRLFRRVKELKEKGYQLKAIKGVLDRLNGVSGEITITEEDMEREMRKTWLAERWPAPDMEGEQIFPQSSICSKIRTDAFSLAAAIAAIIPAAPPPITITSYMDVSLFAVFFLLFFF